MASFNGSKQPYSPSAPPEPAQDQPRVAYPYQSPSSTPSYYAGNTPPLGSSSFGSGPIPPLGPYQPPASSPLSYAPVAPLHSSSSFGSGPIPPPHGQFQPPASSSLSYAPMAPQHSSSSFGSGLAPPPRGYGYGSYPYQYNQHQQQQQNYSSFPPGTHPDVIRSFQMVDRNQNGFVEEAELQEALSRNYQKFSLRTLRLLIFLFKNHRESSSRIGPKEFAEVWSCLGQWREIFERFDRDRSGKIDAMELRDALYSLGYALPPSVLQVLISKYDDGRGRKLDLDFDSFVECGMIVKGLTEKFKDKDQRYTGSATLNYDTFMSMIIPFLVAE